MFILGVPALPWGPVEPKSVQAGSPVPAWACCLVSVRGARSRGDATRALLRALRAETISEPEFDALADADPQEAGELTRARSRVRLVAGNPEGDLARLRRA